MFHHQNCAIRYCKMTEPFLTIFTPTYNRAHTLERLYRSLCWQSCQDFEWLVIDDGSTDGTQGLIDKFSHEGLLDIRYFRKENGGLYTGYNLAYSEAQGELSMCVDSDDFLPVTAVEIVKHRWKGRPEGNYAGVLGLDFDAKTWHPIGGWFPEHLKECFLPDLIAKRLHTHDCKQAMLTSLMKSVSPMRGFPGEKNFNPVYLLLKAGDKYPMLVVNENLCYVDYQASDSMSARIMEQYVDSPRSFAELRLLELSLRHSHWLHRLRLTVHYVAESRLAKADDWIVRHPVKTMAIACWPLGMLLYWYIKQRNR